MDGLLHDSCGAGEARRFNGFRLFMGKSSLNWAALSGMAICIVSGICATVQHCKVLQNRIRPLTKRGLLMNMNVQFLLV